MVRSTPALACGSLSVAHRWQRVNVLMISRSRSVPCPPAPPPSARSPLSLGPPISPDFNALDDAAFAAYKLDLEAWTEYQKTFKADANGRKTDNNCLAFSRTYHCASQFKRCNNGVETDLCVGYCKERKYRCQTVEDCTKGTTEIDCSSASSLTVSTLLVVCSAFLTSFLYL